MLKEIVYWVYQFFSNLRQSKKSKDNGRLNSVMFVSICLFINVLTLLNIIEYYTTSLVSGEKFSDKGLIIKHQ